MTINAFVASPSGESAFGLGAGDRLDRQLRRVGVTPVAHPESADLVLRGDHVYADSVLQAMIEAAPGLWLANTEGAGVALRTIGALDALSLAALATSTPVAPPPGVHALDGAALAGGYDPKLRRRADPFVLGVDDPRVERALFEASYKGVTDLVTKHAWPPLAFPVTRWCARRGITPNQITLLSAVFVVLAFWLFWEGRFAAGLIAAWLMTFLDTVDGKLARTTLSSSRIGDVLDHGIDLIHPPFWWWAWAVGLSAAGMPLNDGGLAVAVIVVGYILQRAEEGVFIARFGIEMHVWRRFDSLFRQITARRNPNLLILTAATIMGEPRTGLIAVAVWTGLCFLVHLVRILQAFAASRQGKLRAWMAEAE